MLIGIQGSGKSTYAYVMSEEKNIPVISSDKTRDENPTMKEELIFPELYKRCAELIKENKDFIYDATNITPKVRKRFFDNMSEYGLKDYTVEAHYFVPDVELSKERISRRNQNPNERYLPIEVVDDYAKNFIAPTLEEGFSKIVKIVHYVHEN